jgi:hypothetical protein
MRSIYILGAEVGSENPDGILTFDTELFFKDEAFTD